MTVHAQGSAEVSKRHHVFLWVFLAIQALFLVWVIAGASTGSTCTGLTGDTLTTCQAGQVGTGIGVALVITFWAVVDVILGISYGVYRLAKRS